MTNLHLQFLDVETIKNKFGEWLRTHRKKNYLTMDALGEKVGVSKQYISVLERGEDHPLTGKPVTPSVKIIELLAKVLNTDVNEALNLAGYASTDNPIPQRIVEAYARSSNIKEKDIDMIANFIEMLDKQNAE